MISSSFSLNQYSILAFEEPMIIRRASPCVLIMPSGIELALIRSDNSRHVGVSVAEDSESCFQRLPDDLHCMIEALKQEDYLAVETAMEYKVSGQQDWSGFCGSRSMRCSLSRTVCLEWNGRLENRQPNYTNSGAPASRRFPSHAHQGVVCFVHALSYYEI